MAEVPVRQECCNCGVVFWITAYMHENRLKDAQSFYCPNGHGQSYGESEADKVRAQLAKERAELAKLQRERDRLKQNEAWLEDVLRQEREKAERLQKRVGAGLCPCCNRSFANLRSHMAHKHPEQAPAAGHQSRGGRARAAKLTAARRSEIASKAAKARWEKEATP